MEKDLNKIANQVISVAEQLQGFVLIADFLKKVESIYNLEKEAIGKLDSANLELGLKNKELGELKSLIESSKESFKKMRQEVSEDAGKIINDAKAEASLVIMQANEKANSIKADALKYGHELGLAEEQLIIKTKELKEVESKLEQIKKSLGNLVG